MGRNRGTSSIAASEASPPGQMTLTTKLLVDCVAHLPPRALLVVSSASKVMQRVVTYEVVVRSVLLKGGEHGKKTLRCMMELMCGGSAYPDDPSMKCVPGGRIWIPSPLRLLRLVLGKRCEIAGCKAGLWKGGKRSMGPEARVNNVRPEWGVFAYVMVAFY